MKPWLALSRAIDDTQPRHLGGLLKWLILVAVTHQRAATRSCATLQHRLERLAGDCSGTCSPPSSCSAPATRCCTTQHVRIDFVADQLSAAHAGLDRHPRHVCLPAAVCLMLIMCLSWPVFVRRIHAPAKCRSNAGGLMHLAGPAADAGRLGPAAGCRAVSELIKRDRLPAGPDPGPAAKHAGRPDEELLAEELRKPRGEHGMSAFLIQQHGAADVRGADRFLLFGLPGRVRAGRLSACFFGLLGIEARALHPTLFQALPQRIFGIMQNDTLLAMPFFTFMGLILERSGMAEDLLDTIGQLFGPVRGGLAFAVIFVGALLAATTGVVAASVISMGLISLPIMLRYGYDRRLATGVIAASGTLAQIIPPSLVLIVMADQLGNRSATCTPARSFPAFMLAGLYAALRARRRDLQAASGCRRCRSKRASSARPDGSSGTPSLLVLAIVAVAARRCAFAHWYYPRDRSPPARRAAGLSTAIGVGVAFVAWR